MLPRKVLLTLPTDGEVKDNEADEDNNEQPAPPLHSIPPLQPIIRRYYIVVRDENPTDY